MDQPCFSRQSKINRSLEYVIRGRLASGYFNTGYTLSSGVKDFVAMVSMKNTHADEPLIFASTLLTRIEGNSYYNIFEPLSNIGCFSKINNAIRVIMSCFHAGNNALKGFRDKKGHYYYAADSIILDENRKPIFLVACTIEPKRGASAIRIYVPGNIFQRRGLVENYIVKILIPWFSSLKVVYFSGRILPISVCVSDRINDYIVVPANPDANNQEEIANMLNSNIELLTSAILCGD